MAVQEDLDMEYIRSKITRLLIESDKMREETLKIRLERVLYPFVLGAAFSTAVSGLMLAVYKLYL